MPRAIATLLLGLVLLAPRPLRAQADFLMARFSLYLDSLRRQASIPGLSAAIVQDQEIVWERGFGHQDLESSIAARPDTPYYIADLTQTLSAALVMQCVERGALDLDDPVRPLSSIIPEPAATVRHVLSHASEGPPGASFKYDPGRYAALTAVVESCLELDYPQALARSILDRLAMVDSLPGLSVDSGSAGSFDPDTLNRYARVMQRLAKPYRVDRRGKATVSAYPPGPANASTGVISTVRDLARFDAALDDGVLLRPETLAVAWTNAVSTDGRPLPCGLGWFVQSYNGERLVWHFGASDDSSSSLILKVPRRRLTLILLANSDGLSATFPLRAGDVNASLFARLFLGLFL